MKHNAQKGTCENVYIGRELVGLKQAQMKQNSTVGQAYQLIQ